MKISPVLLPVRFWAHCWGGGTWGTYTLKPLWLQKGFQLGLSARIKENGSLCNDLEMWESAQADMRAADFSGSFWALQNAPLGTPVLDLEVHTEEQFYVDCTWDELCYPGLLEIFSSFPLLWGHTKSTFLTSFWCDRRWSGFELSSFSTRTLGGKTW